MMPGAPAPAPHRVLVVDDDPDYRLVARIALDGDRALRVVGEAADGWAGARAAAECAPDVVLLECSRGGVFDALPRLRAAAPGARVILLSGHDPADLRLAGRAAGGLAWLTKETPARRLGAEVAAAMEGAMTPESLPEVARFHLGADPTSPRKARRLVDEAVTGLGDLTGTVTLLVSELVTNAVVHAGTGVELVVRLAGGTARVEVTDRSPALPIPLEAGGEDISGRGLTLVGALARRWGVVPEPGGGKTVWFEVDRPALP